MKYKLMSPFSCIFTPSSASPGVGRFSALGEFGDSLRRRLVAKAYHSSGEYKEDEEGRLNMIEKDSAIVAHPNGLLRYMIYK
jgi:hypothetical protein